MQDQQKTAPRTGSPTWEQPTFEWKATEKYHELCNFETEVTNIFLTNNYNIQEGEKVPNLNDLARPRKPLLFKNSTTRSKKIEKQA